MSYFAFKRRQMIEALAGDSLTTVEGVPPLSLPQSLGRDLEQYKIYGNSIQNGTPTPSNPIEVESVGEPILPEEYQQVEYLESTGTQYIDTGIKPDTAKKYNFKTTLKFSTMPSTEVWIIGLRLPNRFQPCGVYTTRFVGGYNTSWTYFSDDLVANTEYSINSTISNGLQNFNGVVTTYTGGWTNTGSIYLFAQNGAKSGNIGTAYFFASVKMKPLTVTENDILIRNFIPCYRKSDNVAGMYDTVNGVFYTNQGTGTFVVGADYTQYKIPVAISNKQDAPIVNLPSEYQQVEYLESTGTQYIQTNIYGNLDSKIEIKFQFTGISSSWSLFGSTATDNDRAFFIASSLSKTNLYANFDSVARTNIIRPNFDTNLHTSKLSKNGWYVDGELCATWTNPTAFTTPYPLMLFAKKSNTYLSMSYLKIYSVKINGVDIIPCYRKSDNVAGMYDTVNNVFYTNQGTGTFIVGADVNTTITNIYLDEPLRKLGDYTDYVDFKDQKVYRNVATLLLDGTTNKFNGLSGASSVNCRVILPAPTGRAMIDTGTSPYFCDRFLPVSATTTGNSVTYGQFNADLPSTSNFRFGIYELATTVAEANDWLVNNNTTLYYPLATPTEESITLPDIATLSGQNYFSLLTNTNSSNTLVKYYKN